MRFRVEPRDVPIEQAARRLGMTVGAFTRALPALVNRGFPVADPDTGNFDLTAIDRWCDLRHHHLLSPAAPGMGPRDAADVVEERLAALKAGAGERNGRKNRPALQG